MLETTKRAIHMGDRGGRSYLSPRGVDRRSFIEAAVSSESAPLHWVLSLRSYDRRWRWAHVEGDYELIETGYEVLISSMDVRTLLPEY